MIELKPCPFCGGKIEHYRISEMGTTITELEIRCENCYAEISIDVPIHFTANNPLVLGDAIAIWNRREAND